VLTYDAPERNKEPILQVLRQVLPPTGRVLEIASGTGQHVVHFAEGLPQLTWQPSDPEERHLDAIGERAILAGLPNLEVPIELDVTTRPWRLPSPVDAIVCINMIHIAPMEAGIALIEEAGRLLPAEGTLTLYGPYRRHGSHTAPSNEAFDANLRARNPAWGVRDLEIVQALAERNGLRRVELVAMPANNFTVVFRKAALAR
jgi:SAM-dependent methyltransferase